LFDGRDAAPANSALTRSHNRILFCPADDIQARAVLPTRVAGVLRLWLQVPGRARTAELCDGGIHMLAFEAKYRDEVAEVQPIWWLGLGVYKLWIGRFYLGFWGLVALFFGAIGSTFWFYKVFFTEFVRGGPILTAIMRGTVAPPPPEVGLRLVVDPDKGFFWLVIMACATITFIAWMMRQVDIARNLKMTYHVPIAYGAVVSSWVTIQIVHPVLMGHWAEGFPLGIMSHLDWVSTFGYRYWNFFYNPFHALGAALLFGSAFVLALHGATILSGAGLRGVNEDNINTFYWDFFGYSVGEIGVHRLAMYFGVFCVLLANLCFVLSGTVVQDWSAFYDFWNQIPIWSVFTFAPGS
jgi:Photosynthetic reaction centre protein